MLAEHPITDQHRQWARKFWNQSMEFDFRPYQMYCDDALVALGLARVVEDSDGKRVEYLFRDYE